MDWAGIVVATGAAVIGGLILNGLSSVGRKLTVAAVARQRQHAEGMLRLDQLGARLTKLEAAAVTAAGEHQEARREIAAVRDGMQTLTNRVDLLEARGTVPLRAWIADHPQPKKKLRKVGGRQ